MRDSTSPPAETSGEGARPAVFLDRDGTLIVDREYLGDPDGVELLPGAARGVARLNRAGIPVLLVTNQSGIGRGYFTEDDFHAVQARIARLLAREDAHLDDVYFCPHAPDRLPACECRKPGGGLFRRAAAEHRIDLGRSFFVGDRLRDVLPALAWGGTAILTGPGAPGEVPPPHVQRAASLAEAVDHVLQGASVDAE